ncbi:hypothetical protein A1O3_08043 [Capronia epimyces CBS 606.96]|uniref:ABM domain-containing protein n=1 Tax=Capronia epimyces CBS 606.96 TaxID=1182542 RepID=W9XQZ8_9EURO|nr:uncharacterized protein A1O3_08043 [Capronia epimyces CBS 606.96]EXJ79760.1 hypothetical protein A1O3_08043 [Capronia epimyces CBS 606.96]
MPQAHPPKSGWQVIESLSSLAPLFRRPTSQCTTRSFFTPATRKGALLGMVAPAEQDRLIAGVEIFTRPSALAAVQASPEYRDAASSLATAAPAPHLTTWYPTAGFVARRNQIETGPAQIVMLAKFVVRDGDGLREKLVDVLGKYCSWVESNELTTLTYSVLTRPDAPNEVLMFERYKDLQALGEHSKTAQFRAMFKATGPFIQAKKTLLSEWNELDGSFVSNFPGGGGGIGGIGAQAKL